MESRSFKKHELTCKHCGEVGVSPLALERLQVLRDLWGKPIIITSAYRCGNHPEEISKKKPGQHALGLAFDIKATPAEQVELLIIAKSLGFKGFGFSKTFIHIDLREQDYVSAWYY